MQNLSKAHEKNVQTNVHQEDVNNILDNVENVPYALRGSMTKTILYWLFCLIAAAELTGALFFYIASLGANVYVAAVVGATLGFVFHGLLHSVLTDTAKGMVFSKMRESKAMSAEVKTNIVLSIVLLLMAACTVYFVGKKGFTAYRATQYETVQASENGKDKPKELGITAEMLTNKKGKISSDKLEQLAAVTTASAKATESTTNAATVDRSHYDATTANVTDIVGSSAFILELLLALLAYSIATAKFAAVIDEIARRKAESVTTANVTANVTTDETASVTPQSEPQIKPQRQIGFSENNVGNNDRVIIRGFQRDNTPTANVTASVTANVKAKDNTRICEHCGETYTYKIHNQKFCSETCRISAWEAKTATKLRKGKKI